MDPIVEKAAKIADEYESKFAGNLMLETAAGTIAERIRSMPVPSPWLPIDSAPLHEDLWVHHPKNGEFLAQHTSLAGLISDQEIEDMKEAAMLDNAEFVDDFEHEFHWWAYLTGGINLLEGDDIPTKYFKLPEPPQ